MATRAVVLGGGGPVGIAWELGLAAGLEEGSVRIADANRIVGTSAGSFAGASLASGRSADALVRDQIAEGERANKSRDSKPQAERPSPPDLGPLIKFMMRRPPNSEIPLELRAEIGGFALSTKTIPEETFIGNFGSIAGDGEKWPRGFACTAVDAQDGTFQLWEESSGVELGRAVASSCAVPGIFPPVTIHGRRYMDGGMRSSTNVDLVKGYERVLVVAVLSNMAVDYMRAQVQREIDILTATGAKVELIVPDSNCLELFGANLMDGTRRGEIALAGIAQGRAEVERIKPFWN